MIKKLSLLILPFILCFYVGCGGGGGTEGDENDPASTSDAEQMQDETGDLNPGPQV